MTEQRKKRQWLPIAISILVALGVIAAMLPVLIPLFTRGNPVGGAVVILLFLVTSVLPVMMHRGTAALRFQAARAREALREEKEFSLPGKYLRQYTWMAFLFTWLVPPAFLLLPGQLWALILPPLIAVFAIRAAKLYPIFEDLGVEKKRYVRWHILAYLASFAFFLALKLLLFYNE